MPLSAPNSSTLLFADDAKCFKVIKDHADRIELQGDLTRCANGVLSGNYSSMKSTEVQTSPIYRNRTLEHLPQSTEPRAVLGSKYVMAKPAQFVKLV